jgi:bifunctional UDP-N-acetylglucosamine pyrophosphorylase/glucosamine-1-phosphate N-acetyltransferase
LVAIVLAAGQSKRMKSHRPKVLHTVAGRSLVHYPVRAARDAGASQVVVVASPAHHDAIRDQLTSDFGEGSVTIVVQDPPRGTGDAARVGLEAAPPSATHVLVLCGDTPLVRSEDLAPLVTAVQRDGAVLAALSCEVEEPRGYGRIRRDAAGTFLAIVEERDLKTDAERTVSEVNAGMYVASVPMLRQALTELTPNNAQGEYYLTDVVPVAARSGEVVALAGSADALVGVNDRVQLCRAEELMFRRIARRHAEGGVTLRGDARVDDTVTLGSDVEVAAGCHLRGRTVVGDGATIDVGCVVTDSTIGSGVQLKPYSVVTESRVEERALIGPYSHLRPGSDIGPEAHIGNFVETKKTRVGRGSKANHLAYLGDGEIGDGVNVGAGTIFCNYDGFRKHTTVIDDGAFIGSDSQIVAPIRIGRGAYVGTGTTVTKDVPDDALALSRVKQQNKEGYASRLRARLGAAAKKP